MTIKTLDDLFAEEEEANLAKARAEIAAEKAAWDALPQAEKDRIIAEQEAKAEAFADAAAAVEEEEDEEEDE